LKSIRKPPLRSSAILSLTNCTRAFGSRRTQHFYIIPPTMAGFLAAVDYGLAVKKQGSLLGTDQSGFGLALVGLGFGQSAALEMIRLSAVRTVVVQEQIGLAISTAQSEARNSAISEAIRQDKAGWIAGAGLSPH
jgi:hypothetical protein